MEWVLGPIPVTCGRRQGESPAHHRALCEQLWVRYLAQGYHGTTLKVFWHFTLLTEYLLHFSLHWVLSQEFPDWITITPINLTLLDFKRPGRTFFFNWNIYQRTTQNNITHNYFRIQLFLLSTFISKDWQDKSGLCPVRYPDVFFLSFFSSNDDNETTNILWCNLVSIMTPCHRYTEGQRDRINMMIKPQSH